MKLRYSSDEDSENKNGDDETKSKKDRNDKESSKSVFKIQPELTSPGDEGDNECGDDDDDDTVLGKSKKK